MDTHHRQPPSSSAANFTHNHHHEQQQQEQEHFTSIKLMFEKPLTPSDVGKLNRLVIPKQHAEKHFPMGGGADQQKGLLLTFEDESGKLWRFRYSYWNSSQSYVLTKGWSRYVKEKRLDAGDVVLFRRHLVDGDRMFIGWRRRFADIVPVQDRVAAATGGGGGGAQLSEVFYDAQSGYPAHHLQPGALHLPYQSNCLDAGNAEEDICANVDTYQREVASTRRLRLFGVNLECQDNSEPSHTHGLSHSDQSDHRYNYSFNNLHHNTMRYHQHEG